MICQPIDTEPIIQSLSLFAMQSIFKKIRVPTLAFSLILFAFCIQQVSALKFDYDIDSFFNEKDANVQLYQAHQSRFENDNNFLLIGVKNSTSIFDLTFMRQIDDLSKKLKQKPEIIEVVSPTTIKEKAITSVGPIKRPIINLESQAYLDLSKSLILNGREYYTDLFSDDNNAILIQLKLKQLANYKLGQKLLENIKTTVTDFGFKDTYFGGRINTRGYYVSKISHQSLYFTLISVVLLIGFLYYSFKSILGVIIPILVLGFTIIVNLAIIQNGIGHVDIMLSMLPSIIFVVGVSYIIHILSRYAEELNENQDKNIAIEKTFKNIWSTILITVITTSIGFLSLYLIQIKPIQHFAIYSAIAILTTGFFTLFLLPVLLTLINPKFIFKGKSVVSSQGLSHGLFITKVLKNSKIIQFSTLGLVLVFTIGLGQIETNNNFLDDLSHQSDLGKELAFFENNFGGIRPFEMAIQSHTDSLLTYQNIIELDKVHHYLENTYQVSGIISPITIIKSANKSFNGGLSSAYILPENESDFTKLIQKMRKKKVFRKYTNVISSNFKYARIFGRNLDYGSRTYAYKNELLSTFLDEHQFKTSFQLTGSAELMDDTNSKIAKNLLFGIGIGMFVVTLIISFIFWSIRIALVSILPNAIPIIVIAGIMGFMGIDLKVATALAFTIVFGIAVDDTIHIMKRIKGELKINNEMTLAITNTYKSTGKAVVLTSLIISAGFLAFISSEFTGLFYFGVLISAGIISALFGDYILLPILLLKLKTKRFIK